MTVPYWVQDSIFYQIFHDRFANGDPGNDPVNVQKWGSPPSLWGFQGGDLRGIVQRLDYLLDLGINAIYLNPIFQANSTHRYDTCDYFTIDPRLGTLDDFHALVDALHRNNMRLILDGVFNHTGRGFHAFVDVLENGEHSAYKDWFHIRRFPLDAYSATDTQNYLCWWNHKALPKLNTSNPQVRRTIFDVARYWIEQGADGWRLDVPNEIDDDAFWEEFRQVVRRANRDAYLLGEIWTPDPRWANDKHFDGLMNYPVREALVQLLTGKENAHQFADRVEGLFKVYARENIHAMYVTLGTHDTERIKTLLGADLQKLKLAYQFLMAYPGAPAIYYGDEIGMEGGKDPDCRRAFPWGQSGWDQELRQWIKTLIGLRKRTPCLRRGEYTRILARDGLYVFARSLGEERVVIAINASADSQNVAIPCKNLKWNPGQEVHNMINGQKYIVPGKTLPVSLPAWSAVWIGS
ncbi:MAG: glycoside hydrolase family 13 protein [Chloroflexota bacterium]